MLSIEVTRECPLSCPGCYAYGDSHLGGDQTLRELADFRGDELVRGVLSLVEKHQPLHVSLVGGEPLVRHRELSRILPELSAQGRHTLVVTSGIIPIPLDWISLPRVRVAVSVDGLPEHHDVRRKPATYEKILKQLEGRRVNIHWTITGPMLQRSGYMEEFVSYWSNRPEVDNIWVSLYTPQRGEHTPEMLSARDRALVASELPPLRAKYPKLLMHQRMAQALLNPPQQPRDCLFSKMSTNYSADLKTRVEPCIFGGDPDCSQCGCAVTSGVDVVKNAKLVGPLKAGHLVRASIAIGSAINRMRTGSEDPARWSEIAMKRVPSDLVQIGSGAD
jgi:Radical SAM superfamily/4Fe-4S single cluster domain